MDEKEWLTSGVPNAMLDYCWGNASARKKRLFGCACCYRAWDLFPDTRCRGAVRVAERFADGASPPEALANAHRAAANLVGRYTRGESYTDEERFSGTAACSNVSSDNPDHSRWTWRDVAHTRLEAGFKWHAELGAVCDLLRDIFGNLFRPVARDPAWLTSDVLALAAHMYESRDFGAMPVLADALQDAGCNNDDVLNHCRDAKQVHVRGCWVVDLVLGKH